MTDLVVQIEFFGGDGEPHLQCSFFFFRMLQIIGWYLLSDPFMPLDVSFSLTSGSHFSKDTHMIASLSILKQPFSATMGKVISCP